MKPNSRAAQHWIPFNQQRAECRLCPRHCRPKQNRKGFCGVRGTENGEIRTFNYGQSLAATEEIIETEAVNHFSPSARILSMGNVGCMMACSFCQNWETSQIKHLDTKSIRHYTPEQLVSLCLENNIPIISWTYNDPVVWHEFVIETSQLAQKNGIKTLYKSAFYIEKSPVEELIDCIDIFSLSLKSLNAEFYQKQTKAKLQPVLDRIQQVAASSRHLELSQLVIPELNDQNQDIEQTIDWIIQHVGINVPLHFVAFHPAYQYTHVERTPLNTLKRARALAHAKGMKYVYLGNAYESDLNDTLCSNCHIPLVKRYGLHADVQNLDSQSHCTQCGTLSPIINPLLAIQYPENHQQTFSQQLEIHWDNEVQSTHILQTKHQEKTDTLQIHSLGITHNQTKTLAQGLDRFIISRRSESETGVIIRWNSECNYQSLVVLDRAHYPVEPLGKIIVKTE
ncbi:MAG: AmmeMemoRadiSam system radical SAM enzyme [Cocleimonas sp.]|nr:AmmeMemoRadiSam system radical SAM enzyme [Cocleimonas sp.]